MLAQALADQLGRGDSMATTVKRKNFPPSKSTTPARSRPVRTSQAENPEYYEHLNRSRAATDDKTRSTSQRPINRSNAGPEGVGHSSAHERAFNEEDEGRHEGPPTAEERTKLLAEKKAIEEDMKLRRRSYNADGEKQERYRRIVGRLGVVPS
jgi:hypothetical protein